MNNITNDAQSHAAQFLNPPSVPVTHASQLPMNTGQVVVYRWREAFLALEASFAHLLQHKNDNIKDRWVIWNSRTGELRLVPVANLVTAWRKNRPIVAFVSSNNDPNVFLNAKSHLMGSPLLNTPSTTTPPPTTTTTTTSNPTNPTNRTNTTNRDRSNRTARLISDLVNEIINAPSDEIGNESRRIINDMIMETRQACPRKTRQVSTRISTNRVLQEKIGRRSRHYRKNISTGRANARKLTKGSSIQRSSRNTPNATPQRDYQIVGVLDSHSLTTNRMESLMLNTLKINIPTDYPVYLSQPSLINKLKKNKDQD